MANNSTDPETKPGCLMFNVEDGEVESETLVSHIGVVIVWEWDQASYGSSPKPMVSHGEYAQSCMVKNEKNNIPTKQSPHPEIKHWGFILSALVSISLGISTLGGFNPPLHISIKWDF